jgi:hypothetical protein
LRQPRTILVLACTLAVACSRTDPRDAGYWSVSCVSGDERYLVAGGDQAALVDLSTAGIRERAPGMVKAVGCDATGGTVIGYGTAFHWPGKSAIAPPPDPGGDSVVGLDARGAWISTARTVNGGRWRGPASVYVHANGETRRLELLPAAFGPVGAARTLSIADGFAVRFGTLLPDGRLLLAAGWQPSRSGDTVEDVPWGFFALDLATGAVAPLTEPLASDTSLNQAWFQRIAASADGTHLVVAAHDGKQMTVGRFERGANRAASVARVPAAGGPSALAVSPDGALVALGIETRGREVPARMCLVDRAGPTGPCDEFRKNVVGLYFLRAGLVVASGDGQVARMALQKR